MQRRLPNWLRENLLPSAFLVFVLGGIGYVLVRNRPTGPEAGMLRIDSAPPGAEIFVDDRFEGTTPTEVPNLTFGEHSLRFEKPGYDAVRETVTVAAREQTIVVTLESTRSASLTVRSDPSGAMVRVDGKESGRTPVSLDGLTPGRHDIVVARVGRVPHRQMVVLQAGETETLSCGLRPEPSTAQTARTTESADDVYRCVRLAHQQIVDNNFEGAARPLAQGLALVAGLGETDGRTGCVREEIEKAYWGRYEYGDEETISRCRDMLETVLIMEVKARPQHRMVRRLLVAMLRESGRWDQLIEAVDGEAIPVDRTNPRDMAFYGQALVRADRPDEALAALLPVYRRHRGSWELTYAIGLGYQQKGEVVKARIKFKQALLHCSDGEGRQTIRTALGELGPRGAVLAR